MRKSVFLLLAVLVVVAGFYCWHISAQGVMKHYLILAKGQGLGSTSFSYSIAALNGRVTRVLKDIGVVLADSCDPEFPTMAASITGVVSVAEDLKYQWISPNERSVKANKARLVAQGSNPEPFSGFQWNLRQIHADQTADVGCLGEGAVVAVLDSGMATNHVDIAPNLDLALSRSFVPGEGIDPSTDEFNHGTHVGGIIAAPINGVGIQGVAPKAKLVAVKVLSETGSGQFGWVISGIDYAASIHVDVINMSLGAVFDRNPRAGDNAGPLMAALNRAINHATAAGTLCVSSAGNYSVNLNGRLVSIPAQSGNGMAISATGPIGLQDFDRLASYSNYGRSVIDVAAPGGDFMSYPEPTWMFDMVLSSGDRQNGYYFAAGTSMAAPHVSGLAALIVGRYGKMQPAQIQAIIEKSADDILKPGADAETGRGRINALKALQ